ncbi:acyl-CoA dehydrogenase family protein [Aquabacter cavernae]|uniref:acyl-CoA dehydrogenase family protein n=1 Tax=Aquabacter cavernae TaxID=2496029 RepID=UPI000F8CA4E8|nr:acyl-CoA dehydrogenase family protein [Aquabacter cavernae]
MDDQNTDDLNSLVAQTASRLFGDHMTHALSAAAEEGAFPAGFWTAAEEAGLTLAMVPEAAGGVGLGAEGCAAIIRLAGAHAVPLPLAETMLANRLLVAGGRELGEGILTFAATSGSLSLRREGAGWRLSGVAARVPYGRNAQSLVVVGEEDGAGRLACVPLSAGTLTPGENIAREPRDDVAFDLLLEADAVTQSPFGPAEAERMGAAVRAIALAGALDTVLELTATYVGERVQFGRTLSKFQAVQQQVAILATQTAAAGGAAGLAAQALGEGLAFAPIAAAKVRAGEAAGIAAGIAHQMHGAMGFSYEHQLHFLTKRLWAWREEFGNEAVWSRRLGADVLRRGADDLWPFIAAA